MDINDFFKNSSSIFETKKKSEGLYSEKLELTIGNKYLVRFVPYIKEGPSGYHKTMFKQHTYAWRNIDNGRWVYVQSPRTWNEPCPISEFYFKAKGSKSESVQAKLKELSYRQQTYYNVYVIDDPVHPENNGKVKILAAGAQISKIIDNALSPSQAQEYMEDFRIENMRNAMFDLGDNGISFEISVVSQGNFSNYAQSRFTYRRRKLGLSKEEIEDICNSCFDLTTVDKRYSYEEAARIFNATFLGNTKFSVTSEKKIENEEPKIVSKTMKVTTPSVSDISEEDDLDDLEIDNLNSLEAELQSLAEDN